MKTSREHCACAKPEPARIDHGMASLCEKCYRLIEPPSASTDDGASPSRTSSSPVECPKCRTQLAFEGDVCGLCNPDFAEVQS